MCRHSQDCPAYRQSSVNAGGKNSGELDPLRSRLNGAPFLVAVNGPSTCYANCTD